MYNYLPATIVPELKVSDSAYCENMGAYSWASRSAFNYVKEVQIVDVPFCWHTEEGNTVLSLPADPLLLEKML